MKPAEIITGVLVLAIAVVALHAQVKEKNVHTVGVILPLTGDVASLGEGTRNGALLAKQNLTNDVRVDLQFEDDQFDPKRTVAAFTKLVDLDRVQAVICFTSAPCSAIAPLAEARGIVLIAVASAPTLSHGRPHVVRLEISPAIEAQVLLEHIESKNYARIGSLVTVQDGIQAGYTALKSDKRFSKYEVVSESVQPDSNEFRTEAAKIVAANPDVIFLGMLPGAAGIAAREIRDFGYKGDFVAMNFIEGEETLKAANGALEGAVYTNSGTPEQWFNESYKNVYGTAPTAGSANMYDAVMLIARSQVNGTPNSLAQKLRLVREYAGALGTFSSVGDGEFSLPVILKSVNNNVFDTYPSGV